MLLYSAVLPLSRKTLNFAAGIIWRHRKSIRLRWPGLRRFRNYGGLSGMQIAWRVAQL